MQILTSITDFAPLLKSPEYVFKKLKESGVDGLEIVMGIKFRFHHEYILGLAAKYNLPILTIHQPIWSGTFYFDENFIKTALSYKVQDIVFHPFPGFSYSSKVAKKYFEKLATAQSKYGITVMLENMPVYHTSKIFKYIYPLNKEFHDMETMLKIANEYNFALTFDTSHHNTPNPQDEPWFEKTLPKIKDIHLSSFNIGKKQHLPLTKGDFNTEGFIKKLSEKKYNGYLNLEIYYPGLINVKGFDSSSIKDSVDLVRSFL